MVRQLLCILSTAAVLAAPAYALELEYRGHIAGAEAGSARVHVENDGARYAVRGRIRTRGVWDILSPWNARFTVTGRIEDGEAAPEELVLREKDRRKDRTVRVAAGVLHQVKNGAERPERAAPAGVDLVSALWVTLRCDAEQVLNNGRHTYTMTRTDHTLGEDGSERCLYDIVDDDGERSEGRIEFGMRHGQRVPLKIELVDSVRRGLELVAATAAPMAAEGSEAPAAPQADEETRAPVASGIEPLSLSVQTD